MANADLLIEEPPDTTDLTCFFPPRDTDKHEREHDKVGVRLLRREDLRK